MFTRATVLLIDGSFKNPILLSKEGGKILVTFLPKEVGKEAAQVDITRDSRNFQRGILR